MIFLNAIPSTLSIDFLLIRFCPIVTCFILLTSRIVLLLAISEPEGQLSITCALLPLPLSVLFTYLFCCLPLRIYCTSTSPTILFELSLIEVILSSSVHALSLFIAFAIALLQLSYVFGVSIEGVIFIVIVERLNFYVLKLCLSGAACIIFAKMLSFIRGVRYS